MRIITFDIETTNQFSDVGSSDPAALELAIVGIHDSQDGSYDSFLMSDLPRLWKVLEKADMLVGFNSDHFDIPLLNKYYPGDLTQLKSLDLLKEVYAVLGRRIKLDTIAEGTLGERKSGHGLQSLKWWREGKIDQVREYCLKDVEITRKIFDFALKNGAVRYRELGKLKDLKLDTRQWLKPSSRPLTQTLGF
ncbi:MAG: ribonuclease H-like domain-containing protein [Patescibacteria group bacterium]